MKSTFKKIIAKLLGKERTVVITPKGSRWGNHLYMFLHAYISEKNGTPFKILKLDSMDYWFNEFQNFSKYSLPLNDLRILDEKLTQNIFYQHFNEDFNQNQLEDFITSEILTTEKFQNIIQNKDSISDKNLTINIRRGDFFEGEYKNIYGFDQPNYIIHVIDNYLLPKIGNINKITVVSDDMIWCKENLDFLQKYTSKVHFPEECIGSPINCLYTIANSKNLIIPNSTFSFWGAYISNAIFNNHKNIYAPVFGARVNQKNIDSYQLNPNWCIIKDFNF